MTLKITELWETKDERLARDLGMDRVDICMTDFLVSILLKIVAYQRQY
jgi:hypothetical protein